MSFKETVWASSAKIMDFLKDKQSATSWQIKVALRISSSLMYLALGVLLCEGKITVEPEGLNYKIVKTVK